MIYLTHCHIKALASFTSFDINLNTLYYYIFDNMNDLEKTITEVLFTVVF